MFLWTSQNIFIIYIMSDATKITFFLFLQEQNGNITWEYPQGEAKDIKETLKFTNRKNN